MNNETIQAIITLLDKAINDISGRKLLSTQEMTDLLLDIRLYVTLNQETLQESTDES